MAKNQNTYEKRRREMEKRQRAAEKRSRRQHRKDAPAVDHSRLEPDNGESSPAESGD